MDVAARLTDEQKKKIIADYVESGIYSATAKKNGVSVNTVKMIVNENANIARKCKQKKSIEPRAKLEESAILLHDNTGAVDSGAGACDLLIWS